jgi:hypothetical protein
VATALRARVGSAAALADRVEHDIELARDPLSDLNLASTVESLTIADMSAALHELDLSRATVLMDGPQDDVGSAVKALGRDAKYVAGGQGAAASSAPGMTVNYETAEQHVLKAELEPALTDRPFPRLMMAVTANASLGTTSGQDLQFTGYTLAAEVGYRYGWTNAIGARLELGRLAASYSDGSGMPQTETLLPVDALALWHLGGASRTWGAVLLGMHLERFGGAMTSAWRTSLMYGAEGGYDLIRHRDHRVGFTVRYDTTSQGSFSYSSIAIGLAYRR